MGLFEPRRRSLQIHQRKEVTTEERLYKLNNVLEVLASTVVDRDTQFQAVTSNLHTLGGSLDRISFVVEKLAGSVAAHDEQIGSLINLVDRNSRDIAESCRQFQAYLNTIHPKQ